MKPKQKAIGRAEFLKNILHETASVAFKFVEDVAEPLRQVEAIAKKVTTQSLIPVEEYKNGPKLLSFTTPPVYLVGEIDKNLTAFPAVCSKDGFLFAYLPHENVLYCSACKSKHVLEYEDERVSTDLQSFSLTVEEGRICLIK